MTKRALLIGINYIGQNGELNGCINDVRNVRARLINHFKFRPRHIKIITDRTRRKPTKRVILKYLRGILRKSVRGDTIYLHYSGHGGYIYDRQGDEADHFDETLVPLDHKQISDDELYGIFARRARRGVKIFAVIDACHSGTAIDLPYNYRFAGSHVRGIFKGGAIRNAETDTSESWSETDTNNSESLSSNEERSSNRKLVQFSKLRSNRRRRRIKATIVMISGCRDPQTSADAYIDGRYQGALTAHFLKSVRRNIPLYKLMVQIHRQLERKGYSQEPQLSSNRRLRLGRHRFRL